MTLTSLLLFSDVASQSLPFLKDSKVLKPAITQYFDLTPEEVCCFNFILVDWSCGEWVSRNLRCHLSRLIRKRLTRWMFSISVSIFRSFMPSTLPSLEFKVHCQQFFVLRSCSCSLVSSPNLITPCEQVTMVNGVCHWLWRKPQPLPSVQEDPPKVDNVLYCVLINRHPNRRKNVSYASTTTVKMLLQTTAALPADSFQDFLMAVVSIRFQQETDDSARVQNRGGVQTQLVRRVSYSTITIHNSQQQLQTDDQLTLLSHIYAHTVRSRWSWRCSYSDSD